MPIQWHEAVMHYLVALNSMADALERGDRDIYRYSKYRKDVAAQHVRFAAKGAELCGN